MKVTIALLVLQNIGAQDMPWPGVLNLDHIRDGFILAEAVPEPTGPKATEPEETKLESTVTEPSATEPISL